MATKSKEASGGSSSLLLQELVAKQQESCQLLLNGEAKSSPHSECLQKALVSAQLSISLLEMKEPGDKAKAYQQALQKYVQSILDSTYYQECNLVDYDFPEVSLKDDINGLLDQFSSFMKLCGSTQSQLINILGEEIVECIHWRVGALMYMLANTIMNMESRRETVDKEWLRECCYVGVLHLMKVFEVRSPVAASPDEYVTNDARIVELLSQGIRSDTHMLALAYGGELSYWCHVNSQAPSNDDDKGAQYPELYKVIDTVCPVADRPSIGSVGGIGMKFLSKYIELAKGSLSLQSWQCERPEELLTELNKMAKE